MIAPQGAGTLRIGWIALTLLVTSPLPGNAQITQLKQQFLNIYDTPPAFQRFWEWKGNPPEHWPGGQVQPAPPLKNWSVSLDTDWDNNDNLVLSAEMLHKVKADKADQLANRVRLTLTIPELGGARATSKLIEHPTNDPKAPHWDAYVLAAFLPDKGAGTIQATGKHLLADKDYSWSYLNLDPKKTQSITVKARTADGNEYTAQGKRKAFFNLPIDDGRLRKDTRSYEVTVDDPGNLTHTTLAFLGNALGSLEAMDLALATELFSGTSKFYVPALFNESQELYVGVDLVQWLSFPSPFAPGDVFDFQDGITNQLPGFFVSTEPITFDAFSGFNVPVPWSGSLVVKGLFDGQAVPEPGPLTSLIAMTLTGMASIYRSRNLRRHCQRA